MGTKSVAVAAAFLFSAIAGTLYFSKHPKVKSATEKNPRSISTQSPLSEGLQVALREKSRGLFDLPKTNQSAQIESMVEASALIEKARDGGHVSKQDLAIAQVKLTSALEQDIQIGAHTRPAFAEALNATLSDLKGLAADAPVTNLKSGLKVAMQPGSQVQPVSSGPMSSPNQASNLSALAPSPAPRTLSKAQNVVARASTTTRTTSTCTDISPVDPTPSTALGSDLFTTQTAALQTLAKQLVTPQAIFQFVKNQIAFSGNFGAGQTADQLFTSGSGSSADKASLMIALLRANGIPAVYVGGELKLSLAQLQGLLGTTSAYDTQWALLNLASQYYSGKTLFTTLNGVSTYYFPEVWVRAYINNAWVDLDPVNLNNNYILQNYSSQAVSTTFASVGNWFFAKDSQGNYVKSGTLADQIAKAANPYIRSIGGSGASISDVGAIRVGQIGGLVSSSLPAAVPGDLPCRELEALTLPTTYQFMTAVTASDYSTNTQMFSVVQPTASLRTGTLYVSNTAGLYGTTTTTGSVQLALDGTTLASVSHSPSAYYTVDYKLTLPTRFSNTVIDRTIASALTTDVYVINHMVDQVTEGEVIAQAQKVLSLSAPTKRRLMAELLRLGALEAVARASLVKNELEQIHGVGGGVLHTFVTGTTFGILQTQSGSSLGVIPVGANIDWQLNAQKYPKVGNHASYGDYANITAFTGELIVSCSPIEGDIWYELFGLPSTSTSAILQTGALQIAAGGTSPNNTVINGYALSAANQSTLVAMFDAKLQASWQSWISYLANQQPLIYATGKEVTLASGYSGAGLTAYPTSPTGGAYALLSSLSIPLLSGSPGGPGARVQIVTTGSGSDSGWSNSNDQSLTRSPSGTSGSGQEDGKYAQFPTAGGSNTSPPVNPQASPLGQGQNSPSNPTSGCDGQPVELSTGGMWHQFTDFEVPGRVAATNLSLVRTYLSMPEDTFVGGFGAHWVSNWETHLTQGSGYVAWTDEQGGVWRFTGSGPTFSPPPGQFATLTKGASSFQLRKKNGVIFTFSLSPLGRLQSIADPHGETAQLTYDTLGQLASVTSPFAGSITFTYTNSRITNVLRSREAFNYKYAYDTSSRLISSTDFSGRVTSYAYNAGQVGSTANGLLSTITDPIGRQILFTYYNNGKAFTQTEPGNVVTTFIFSPYVNDIHTWVMSTNGNLTEYVFDNQYRLVNTIRSDAATQSFTWTAQNQIATRTDALGYTTYNTYDSQGNLISLQRPSDSTPTTFTYDPTFNQVTRVTPPLGSPKTFTVSATNGDILGTARLLGTTSIYLNYTRDAFGNPLGVTSNLATYTNARDANGFLTTSFDARNPATLSYDARGRVTKIVYKSGRTQNITYNNFDNVTQVTDTAGPTLVNTYDTMQRLTTRTVMVGTTSQVTQYAYDVRDRVTSITDPLGKVTQFQYQTTFVGCHVRDLPTTITNPSGQVTQMAYDDHLRLINKIAPNGSLTQYEYNQRDDLIAISDPNGHRTEFRFNGNGNKISEISTSAVLKNGVVTNYDTEVLYSYDAANRLTLKSTGVVDGSATASNIIFSYDSLDRVISRTEETKLGTTISVQDTVTIAYENQLSPILQKQVANVNVNDTFSHEFVPPYAVTGFGVSKVNSALNVLTGSWAVTPTQTASLGSVVDSARNISLAYTYDPAGRATQILGSNGSQALTFKSTYDGFGRLSTQTSTGINRTFTFDLANQLTSLGASPGISETLTYDPSGRIAQIQTSTNLEKLGYDPSGQLISYSTSVPNASRSFGYDPNGNRTSDSLLGSLSYLDDQLLYVSSLGTQYQPDSTGQGQLASSSESGYTESFQYGVNGKVNQYSSTQTNCGGSACNDILNVAYKYDGLGRRIEKLMTLNWTTSPITHSYAYLFDMDEIFLSQSTVGSTVGAVFLQVDNQGARARLGEHLGQVSSSSNLAYLVDYLGSVLNAGAQASASIPAYGPFGESSQLQINASTPAVTYGFAGGEYDFESHRYFFRARDYDPETGRFLTKDPLSVMQGGDINPYRYVMNNPVNLVDPAGLFGVYVTSGGAAGLSDGPQATHGSVVEGSSGIVIGTQDGQLGIGGLVSTGHGSSIVGGTFGAGFNIGLIFGDVSSAAGQGTNNTTVIGPFGFTRSYDPQGNMTGVSFSPVGKGGGYSEFNTQTDTTAATVNFGNQGITTTCH